MVKSPATIATKKVSLKRNISIEVMIDEKETAEEALNEGPDKKIIKLSETTENLNPLEYFSRFLDIPEMILQHFNGKDLIKISEVTPNLYNFIASSKVLMEKIKVVSDGTRKLLPEDVDLLKDSSRLYESIEVRRSFDLVNYDSEDEEMLKVSSDDYFTNSELNIFYDKFHDWKKVSLRNIYFRKKIDMWKLLASIQSTVESFSIINNKTISFNSQFKYFKTLKFPQLKQLKIYISDNCLLEEGYTRALRNSIAIEKLEYEDSFRIDRNYVTPTMIRNVDNLTKMLNNFDTLTNLKIKSSNLDHVFKKDCWKNFPFGLKSLTMAYAANTKYFRCQNSRNHFRDFLKSQSDHLEEMMIDPRVDKQIFYVIMRMPKLNSLCLPHFLVMSDLTPTEISFSITDLRIKLPITAVTLKFLLESMPNVRSLTLNSVNEEQFEIMKSMKKKFKVLRIGDFVGVDRKEFVELLINKTD